MSSRVAGIALIAVAALTGACASREDWNVWRSHTSHFASGEHGVFSVRNNKEGANPRVSRTDIERARQQDWWGLYQVAVSPDRVFQN